MFVTNDCICCWPRDSLLARYRAYAVCYDPICMSVRLSLSQSSIEITEWMELVVGIEPYLHCIKMEIGYLQKSSRTCPNSEFLRFFCFFFRQGTSIVTSVVNLVRPMTVASLSHWASIFAYSTVEVTQRVARVHLRQLWLMFNTGNNSTCSQRSRRHGVYATVVVVSCCHLAYVRETSLQS